MKTEQARVSLSGEMYRKGDRWWWKVRLPGENRVRARSLCPSGSRTGTTSRRVAEEVALAMWETAVVAQSRQTYTRECRESARAKAEVHRRLHVPLVEPRAVDGRTGLRPPESGPSDIPELTVDVDLTAGCEDLFNFANALMDPAGQAGDDMARCECCHSTDFYEEYLMPIDSGQQLCPRCLHALQEKIQQMAH